MKDGCYVPPDQPPAEDPKSALTCHQVIVNGDDNNDFTVQDLSCGETTHTSNCEIDGDSGERIMSYGCNDGQAYCVNPKCQKVEDKWEDASGGVLTHFNGDCSNANTCLRKEKMGQMVRDLKVRLTFTGTCSGKIVKSLNFYDVTLDSTGVLAAGNDVVVYDNGLDSGIYSATYKIQTTKYPDRKIKMNLAIGTFDYLDMIWMSDSIPVKTYSPAGNLDWEVELSNCQ
jgi:hypothetical protein